MNQKCYNVVYLEFKINDNKSIFNMKKLYLVLFLTPMMSALAQEPPEVTAQQFVNLQQGENAHEGFRRAHAKGICLSGEFRSNGQLASHSKRHYLKRSMSLSAVFLLQAITQQRLT